MVIDVKYNPGDWVNYRIARETNQDTVCPFCNGSKVVEGNDKSILPCPKCNGLGTVKVLEYREGSAQISSVNVQYNSSDARTYADGPKITYYTNMGTLDQNEVDGVTQAP